MQLIEDADCDLVGDFARAPSSRDGVPSRRGGDNDVSLLHLSRLLDEALSRVDQCDL